MAQRRVALTAGIPLGPLPLVFGGGSIGGLYAPVSEDEAARTLEAGWEAGIRAFDTAPHYGVGLSERRIGDFLAGRPRREFTVSTKVGRLLVPATGSVVNTILLVVVAAETALNGAEPGPVAALGWT